MHGGTLVLKTLCLMKGIAFLSPWEYYTEAGLVWVFFFKEKHPQRWLVSGPQLGGGGAFIPSSTVAGRLWPCEVSCRRKKRDRKTRKYKRSHLGPSVSTAPHAALNLL